MNNENPTYNIQRGLHNQLCGFYRAQVISPKNEVVQDSGWHKNLILNKGMDALYVYRYAQIFANGCAGSGSRPNSISSGNSTITQSGAIITLWPSTPGLQCFSCSFTASATEPVPNEMYYSSSLQAGDVIIYGNLSQSTVLGVDMAGGRTASVDTSYTIPSGSNQTFTIWKTSQIGLQKEKRRESTYLDGAGNCGTTTTTGSSGFPTVRTFRRTFDFTTEVSGTYYSEVGVAWGTTLRASASVFSRMLLPQTMSVPADYKLRFVYDLQVSITPNTVRYITASISGWPNTICTESLQTILTSTVGTDGASGGIGQSGGADTADLEPAGPFHVFISGVSTPLSVIGSSSIDRGTVGALDTNYGFVSGGRTGYVTGSYQCYKTATFTVNQVNTSSHRIVGFGFSYQSSPNFYYPYNDGNYCSALLFNNSQSKSDIQTLAFTWKFAWGRTIQ